MMNPQEHQQINIQTIAEELIKEIEIEVGKASDAAKVAEGARQGVILLFNRIVEASKPPKEESSGQDTPVQH